MGTIDDLTAYLLGDQSELRPLLEAIGATDDAEAQGRAALEYVLVLAGERYAANRRPPEGGALGQIRDQYARTLTRDGSGHARLLKDLYGALERRSPADVTTALRELGLYHRHAGRYRMARASFFAAVEMAKRLEGPVEQLEALFWLGVTQRYLGNLDEAEKIHEEQAAIAQRSGLTRHVILAQNNLGLVLLRRGRIPEARERVLRALNRAQELGDRELEGNSYHCLMLVETEDARMGEAAASGWEAYQRYESTAQRLRALQDCAAILCEAGLFEPARAAHEIVLSAAAESALRLRSKIGLVEVAAAKGDEEYFEAVVADLTSDPTLSDLPYESIRAHRAVGLGYAALGNLEKGRQHLMQSLGVARKKGYLGEAAALEEELASLSSFDPAQSLRHATDSEYTQLRSIGQRIIEERARGPA